ATGGGRSTPPQDTVELSPAPARGRSWWTRVKDWALGSSEDQARQQAGTAGLAARVAEQPPPPPSAPGNLEDLARAMLAPISDSSVRRKVSAALTGGSPAEAALKALKSIPSSYTATRGRVAEAAVSSLPGHRLAGLALSRLTNEEARYAVGRTSLEQALLGSTPAQAALAMVRSIGSTAVSSRATACQAMLEGLSEDPAVGAAARLGSAMWAASDDCTVRFKLTTGLLEAALRGETPGHCAMAAVDAIPSNFPSNRSRVLDAVSRTLERDSELAPFCRVANTMRSACDDKLVAATLVRTMLREALAGSTVAQAAHRAVKAIPANYPSNRARAGIAALGMFQESQVAMLCLQGAGACDDNVPRNAILGAALEAMAADTPPPPPVLARAVLAAIPMQYPSNRRKAATAILQDLRATYSDPDALSMIDQAVQSLKGDSIQTVLDALGKLATFKTAAQQVEAMARAVTGQAGEGGVEERGQMLIVGGTRLKVKKPV
ncbi:MAG: hypothetical protein AB1758_18965, partial [Candidatus Eremiobacterota bacterium]